MVIKIAIYKTKYSLREHGRWRDIRDNIQRTKFIY